MPFQPVPNCYQVNVRQLLDGQVVENVFGVRSDDGSSPLDMSAVAEAFISWWGSELAPQLSVDIQLTEVEVRDLNSEEAGSAVAFPETPLTGILEQGALPNNDAFCVSVRTGQGGRSHRGRKYVAGIPKTAVGNSTLLPGVVSDIVAAFNQLRAILESLNAVLVVISRVADGIERLTGTNTVVTAFTAVDATMDSQRRRLPGRGK